MKKKGRLSFHTILPGFLCAFVLFIFAPIDLYCSISSELWFSLKELIPWLLILAAVTFAGITLLCCILPKKLSVIFRAGVYACSFLLWLQGNLLVKNYGTLNGERINWDAYRGQEILNMVLWIAVILTFIFLMLRFRKKFRRIVEAAACLMIVTQLVTLGVLLFQYEEKQQEEHRFLSNENEFVLSPEANTLVFIPDSFDGNLMTSLVEEYPAETADLLPDFTFYPDTVAGAARTKYAIPYILIGDTNKEEQSYMEYLEKGFASSPLISELATGKYETGIYSVSQYMDMTRNDAIGNISTGVPQVSSGSGLTAAFMKLVGYRYMPSLLARYFWMYTGDFERWKSEDNKAAYSLNDSRFYGDLTKTGLKADAGKPVFRLYHLTGAHSPFTLNRNVEQVENSTEEEQALGSLRIVAEYMRQLKELGLYDRTTVIVMADHGYHIHSNAEQCPLFMVKPTGTSHPFEISDVPLSYASMAEMITGALQGQKISPEDWRADGTRYFYYQSESNGVVNLTEYAVNGPVAGQDAVTTGTVYHENTLNLSRAYVPGTVLYFDSRETARNCIVSGFSLNEGKFTWTIGNDAEMTFELPEPTIGTMELVLDHGAFYDEQTVEVWVNEEHIDTYYAVGEGIYSVVIPAYAVEGTELRLRLHLPDACSPAEVGMGDDGRQLALSMRSIVIREMEEEEVY